MATSPGTRISARIAAIEESATLAVDAKYKAMQAAGEDVIGFAAGEPDFPTPAHIVEAAVEACKDPKNHKYSPAGGLPELKEAIAAKTARDSGYTVAASQVLVTNGGKHALYDAFATLLDPGDEALLPSPYWTTYPESIKLAGGVPVIVPTDISTGFKATVEQLDAACTERTKLLVFVSPSNPSGAVYSPAEIKAIGEWAVSRGIWVVTDEIYEHLTYDQAVFAPMPVLVPDLADRCVIVNGVAKTYAMTGWRVGWVIGPQDVITASFNLQSHATSNVSNVAQRAALAAVSGGLEDVAKFREAFNRRRLTMYEMLSAIDGVEVLLPEGAFYAYPSFESFVGTKVAGRQVSSTLELSTVILEEAKVAFVPGEAFGTPGYARFSFAMADEPMAEGIRRIAKALS